MDFNRVVKAGGCFCEGGLEGHGKVAGFRIHFWIAYIAFSIFKGRPLLLLFLGHF